MSSASTRYDRVAVGLHSVIGIALLAQIVFGIFMDNLAPRGSPARATVVNLHKSCGLALFALIIVRLAWRLTHAPPPWPASLPAWQQRSAKWTHRALYACMLLSPLSGATASNFSKHGIVLFGHALAPLGPDLPAVYRFFNRLHDVVGWTFAALVVLHVAAALMHSRNRDPVAGRMSLRGP